MTLQSRSIALASLFVVAASSFAASAKQAPLAKAVGGNSALISKALGKPKSMKMGKATIHFFTVADCPVYRVEEQDGVVNRVFLQRLAKNQSIDQVLAAVNVKVAGQPVVQKIGTSTTTWKWAKPGSGSKIQSVFVRKSLVEIYHDDAKAAGLKPFKDVIYTIIVQGPRPKGQKAPGPGLGLG